MCGIVGAIAKGYNGFFTQQQDSFYQMLYADAVRGEDSTGIIGVENDSTFHIAKDASSADWFINQFRYSKETKDIAENTYKRGKVWIGHNRKKTSGSVKDETAHPFVVNDTFAMVHNGTLYNHSLLAKTEVDSEALAIHLHKAFTDAGGDKDKLKKNLEAALADVYGAYAVVIYDQERHTVHLLRNKDRPLAIIETENCYYFMSEPLMGGWILSRNNYKYETLKAEVVPEHMLITFDLENNTKVWKEQLTPKKATSTHGTQQQWGGASHHGKTKSTNHGAAGVIKSFMTQPKDLKRFQKNWIGKRISFFVSDVMEKNLFSSIEQGETEVTLFAEHEEIGWAHDVLAEVDLEKLKITEREDIFKPKWSGVIDRIECSKVGKLHIIINPESCKPIAMSIVKGGVSFAETSKMFREHLGTLTSDELEEQVELNKEKWATWQATSAYLEIGWRKSITSVEHAAKVAKSRDGCLLTQVQRNGMFVYQNDDGRIYYEVPIAVH